MEEKKMKVLEAFKEFLEAVFENELDKGTGNDKQPPAMQNILTFKEVCNHFHCSPTTLERRIREGLKYSQAARKGNRLFKLSDCEQFFNLN